MTSQRVRVVWGLGISIVMMIAVGPYPVTGLFVDDEIPHRIHNIVGSVQYLPLWAIPVLMFTLGRDRASAWRLAFASSVVMAGVGLWSGDLIESLSWMPLVTLLPLWPRDVSWRSEGISWFGLPGVALTMWVAAMHAPDFVDVQRLSLDDSHSTRFHFSGMAAAYLAIAAATVVVVLFSAGLVTRALVALSTLVAGVSSLVWSDYTSSLVSSDAWLLVVAAPFALVGSRPRISGTEAGPPVETRSEIIGIYDADSTIVGELSYWIGARVGVRHCSLCDITHGTFTVKSEWRECERKLELPFVTYHRNDAPADVLAAAAGRFPIVLRRGENGVSVVMLPDELDRFDGSPEAFVAALGEALVGE